MTDTQDNLAVDLSHLGLIHVTGTDVKSFLQGQTTCHLDEITETTSRLGAHCNAQGRVLSLFRLFLFQDNYYLQLPLEMVDDTIRMLNKYAQFSKVNLQDATASLKCVGYQGQGLAKIFPLCPTQPDAVMQEDLIIIRLHGDRPRYELIGETNTLLEVIAQLHATTPNDSEMCWKYSNMMAGVPQIYRRTSGKFLPHEINLPELHGVSFEKGCYIGQEIIARMHYRGQTKKKMRLARVQSTTCPLPGGEIYQDAPCGTIVDSCQFENTACLLQIVPDKEITDDAICYLDSEKKHAITFLTQGIIHV